MHFIYYFGRGLTMTLLFIFTRWRVRGKENLPERGPLLIVCNHLHLADPPIVACSLKLRTVFMAKDELFHNWWSHFWVKNFGAFPVRRGGIDRQALKQAEDWLKQGVSLIMFPEGRRSPDSRMQPALSGAALIASRLGVPILPVSITGTEKLRKPGGWFTRPVVAVTIGRPFNPPPTDGKLSREELKKLTAAIMVKVAGLLPPEYRGVYAGGDDAAD